jgi:sarcosine oxidase subunit gamma
MPEPGPVTPSTRGGGFQVRPASALAVLRLKSWRPFRGGSAPLKLAGIALPASVGAVAEGLPRVLCTGPGEWLLVYAPSEGARLRNILAPELTSQGFALVDLTDGLAVFEVSGSHVREVLAKSCGLDFDSRYFGAGHCARTRFAQISVVIDCAESLGVFQLYVPRSYAPYLKNWLLDAAVGLVDSLT